MKLVLTFCYVLLLSVSFVSAQSLDDVRGTWSGEWKPEAGPRDRVTVEFERDGDVLAGRLLNPDQLDLTHVTFDEAAGKVVAEGIDPDSSVDYRLEVTFEEGEVTRMDGILDADSRKGEVELVKWTYVPRLP